MSPNRLDERTSLIDCHLSSGALSPSFAALALSGSEHSRKGPQSPCGAATKFSVHVRALASHKATCKGDWAKRNRPFGRFRAVIAVLCFWPICRNSGEVSLLSYFNAVSFLANDL